MKGRERKVRELWTGKEWERKKMRKRKERYSPGSEAKGEKQRRE